MHEILEGEALRNALDNRLVRLANRLAEATGEGTPYGLRKLLDATMTHAHGIAGGFGLEGGEALARTILRTLVDEGERDDPAFWSTALGRAIAWWTGGPEGWVSRHIAAAILGTTRQSVHELVKRQRLTGAVLGDGFRGTGSEGVTPESLRRLLRERYPLEGGTGGAA